MEEEMKNLAEAEEKLKIIGDWYSQAEETEKNEVVEKLLEQNVDEKDVIKLTDFMETYQQLDETEKREMVKEALSDKNENGDYFFDFGGAIQAGLGAGIRAGANSLLENFMAAIGLGR